MSEFELCKKCDLYGWTDSHRCQEFRYRWLRIDGRDIKEEYWQWETAHGTDPEELVKKLCEDMFYEGDGNANDVDDIIEIENHGKFRMSAEYSVNFYAQEIE